MKRVLYWGALLVLLPAGCGGERECRSAADCGASEICAAGQCRTPCTSDADCAPSAGTCDVDTGRCSAGPGSDAGAVVCASDRDCDDGVYCNGVETCRPGDEQAGAAGCVAGADPCASDQTCDQSTSSCRSSDCAAADADRDGHDRLECGGDDCDDADPNRYPGKGEICDAEGQDEDCDSETLGGRDADGDGYVDAGCCNGDRCGRDCDDSNPGVSPAVPDPCDGVDNDCDSTVDEGGVLYRDADNDGRGDPGVSMTGGCMVGWVFNDEDCDDARSETYLGAREMCDELDNDCSNAVDPGGPEPAEDMDGDQHSPVFAMCLGRGEVGALGSAFPKDDCDDTRDDVYTGAVETCDDEVDQDCDDVVDNPTQRICTDTDGDGHGDPTTVRTIMTCEIPTGSVPGARCDDCDDRRVDSYPGNREICDRRDNDCSSGGGVDASEDVDSDGYASIGASCAGRGETGVPDTAYPKTDCADSDVAVNPGVTEVCDGEDSDCSTDGGAATDEDADGDFHAPTEATCLGLGDEGAPAGAYPRDDCDDTTTAVNGGLSAADDVDNCDGLDNDCDPSTSERARLCHDGGYCGEAGQCLRHHQVVQLAASLRRTCQLLANGTVHCWGDDSDLGVATAVAGLTDVVEIAAGRNHFCVRINDGTVRCWGQNETGQLGDGTTTNRPSPVPVEDLTGVVELGAGGHFEFIGNNGQHTCARLRDGTVRCWGNNLNGVLGVGTTTHPVTEPMEVMGLSGVAEIAVGGDHTCARREDHTVWCWGYNFHGQVGDGTQLDRDRPVLVAGVSDAAALAAGEDHTCARVAEGFRCWGANGSGQLGTGVRDDQLAPVAVIGAEAGVEIGAGDSHTCGRRSDGTASCWGGNWAGQLGDGTTMDRLAPTEIPGLAAIVEIAAGMEHTCARLADGTSRCWGLNEQGQLGDGTTENQASPVAAVARPRVIGLALPCVRLDDGRVRCWGTNTYGQLGDGTTTSSSEPTWVEGVTQAVQLMTGGFHRCSRTTEGVVNCWGANGYGQSTGDGTTMISQPTPVEVPDLVATDLAGGSSHTCALIEDGTVQCWGWNGYGQLGDGTMVDRPTPAPVIDLSGAVEVVAGNRFSCARLTAGSVSCWGRNEAGALGDGTATDSATPVPVTELTEAVALTAGQGHACALLTDASVTCWGQDTTLVPSPVPGLGRVASVSAGSRHTCALLEDATVWCWGTNDRGQLGDGTTEARSGPVQVVDLPPIAAIAAGAGATCALERLSGAVRCWGSNIAGHLGDGTSTDRSRPSTVWTL